MKVSTTIETRPALKAQHSPRSPNKKPESACVTESAARLYMIKSTTWPPNQKTAENPTQGTGTRPPLPNQKPM